MIRPTHAGTVWQLSFIHVKPGWILPMISISRAIGKKNRKLSNHSPNDWNLMLMVEYKDLASVETNEDKVDALLQKMFGGDEKVTQGYKERTDIREVMGTRLAREVILERKK
jgi:hypothetical protein